MKPSLQYPPAIGDSFMGSPLETGGGEGCIHALKRVKDPGPSAETLGPGWPVFSCGCSADKAGCPYRYLTWYRYSTLVMFLSHYVPPKLGLEWWTLPLRADVSQQRREKGKAETVLCHEVRPRAASFHTFLLLSWVGSCHYFITISRGKFPRRLPLA